MSLGKPTANIIIRRTNKPEAEEWIRKTHNTLPKFPKNGLLDIIGAYNFENRLMGIMVLNTPPHVASKLEDAPVSIILSTYQESLYPILIPEEELLFSLQNGLLKIKSSIIGLLGKETQML